MALGSGVVRTGTRHRRRLDDENLDDDTGARVEDLSLEDVVELARRLT